MLSVGLTDTAAAVRSRLERDCGALIREGFKIAIDEKRCGGYTFLGCSVVEGELSFKNYERLQNRLKNDIARILTEVILQYEEEKMIGRIIREKYAYLSREEQAVVQRSSVAMLARAGQRDPEASLPARRDAIMEKLLEYFGAHHELVMEGFLHFRLKEYRGRLAEWVGLAADEYMQEAEYMEFVNILRSSDATQPMGETDVHVLFDSAGAYEILAPDGAKISAAPCGCAAPRTEDALLNELAMLKPRRIILHGAGRRVHAAETIRRVFAGRTLLCTGCGFCGET